MSGQKNKNKPQPKRGKNKNKDKNKQNGGFVNVAKAPVSVGTVIKMAAPKYSKTNHLGVTIDHKELIGPTISSNAGDIYYGYSCNPGLDNTFPWLAGIAAQYEEYKFDYLKFHYITRVSTTQSGNVLGGFDSDAADPLPDREEDLASLANAVEGPAWRNMTFVVDKKFLQKWLYVRTAGLDNNQDIKTYDVGKFVLMLTRDTSVQVWGKLWVEFRISFRAPQKSLRNVTGEMISIPNGGGAAGNEPFHGLYNSGIVANFGNLSGGVGFRRLGGLVMYPSLSDGNPTNLPCRYLSINGLRPGYIYQLITYTAGTGNSYLTVPTILAGASQTYTNVTGSNSQSTQWASLAANNSLFAAGDITFKVNANTFQVIIQYPLIVPTTQPSILIRIQEVGSNSLF